LPKEGEQELREELIKGKIKVKKGKSLMCPGLDEISKVISVGPEVWDGTCHRQGSWYRESEKNGQYLIISSLELSDFESHKEAIITKSDFSPPVLATVNEMEEMVKDEEFKPLIPQDWNIISDLEKRIWIRWARRSGSDADWATLFLTHTANHANFIKPRFFIEENGQRIPYSIHISANLCSCCLELFQVIGDNYPKKLVSPCAGAVIFSRLPKDKYLLVERPANP